MKLCHWQKGFCIESFKIFFRPGNQKVKIDKVNPG